MSDRELEAKMAELMGFAIIREDTYDYLDEPINGIYPDVPHYFRDIADAMQVMEKMRERGIYICIVSQKDDYLITASKFHPQFNCYINLVGGQDGLVFDGGSFVAGPDGNVITSGKRFDEDIVFFDVDASSSAVAEKNDKLVVKNLKFNDKSEGREAVGNIAASKMDRIDEIYKALVLGTRDYLCKNGFKKCVLGLSGGIDSALTAVIAREAVGAGNVMALSMPSQFSSEDTHQDARKIADNLGISLQEIPIENICSVYHKDIDQVFGGESPGISGENLQARVRGNILMAFSNKFGWLVLTTGNKSEAAVGYCTLYGDTAGGFAVIGDVLKTTVYELSRYINKKEARELIPESVISREPSAELSPGQKDTDSLPPYDLLDPILKAYIEEHLSFDDINARHPDTGFLKEIINMVDRTEYKRRQVPPGVKITHWALGRDRRLPITNRYREPGI